MKEKYKKLGDQKAGTFEAAARCCLAAGLSKKVDLPSTWPLPKGMWPKADHLNHAIALAEIENETWVASGGATQEGCDTIIEEAKKGLGK